MAKKKIVKGKAKPAKKKVKATKGKKKAGGPVIAYIGLGSNVGDREEYLEQAIFLLEKVNGILVTKKSSNYETEAEGVEDQPAFLNSAIEIETTIPPHKLLKVVQDIENTLGRERGAEWGPRTIDLDILIYGDEIVSDDKLQIPHPLLQDRVFVLKPLAEIATETVHPTLETTIGELFEEKKAEMGEQYDDALPGFKEIKGSVPDDFERW